MLLKLAWRNIRHSFRDYTIYFLTILFGVAVFYAFNSIGEQSVMMDIETASSESVLDLTQQMIGLVSSLIAFVLGFLVIYSNGFLIRRRKREFGTYMLLGMPNTQVSLIMLLETVLVGILSLIIGLLIGVLLSQGLSFVTAMLFGTVITNYQFVFSFDAFILTIVCFAVIYVVVAVFNTFTINRQRLINLLNANELNQKQIVRNPWICLVVFILSIAILAFAYWLLIKSRMQYLDSPEFIGATVCMLIGTLLLFWSLAGFVIAVITKLRGVYFRGLVPFTVRQIASRINTAFASLWMVCIMLFFSITIFSIGMGLVQAFVGDVEKANPYDASLCSVMYLPARESGNFDEPADAARKMQEIAPNSFGRAEKYNWNMKDQLYDNAPVLWDETVSQYAQLSLYEAQDTNYAELLGFLQQDVREKIEAQSNLNLGGISIVSESDVNDTLRMLGKSEISLESDQCLIVNTFGSTAAAAKNISEATPTITLQGDKYKYGRDVVDLEISDNSIPATALITVVPDKVIDSLIAQGAIPYESFLNIMYQANGKTAAQNDVMLREIVVKTQPIDPVVSADTGDSYTSEEWPVSSILTAYDMIDQSRGLKVMITYLAVYIAFILLVATAAVLAVQQLSQTADSLPRYMMLSRIGCSTSTLDRSLFAQVAIYFLLPLAVAICHSACAIYVTNESLIKGLGVQDVSSSILAAAILVFGIYGIYMIITYLVSRYRVNEVARQS